VISVAAREGKLFVKTMGKFFDKTGRRGTDFRVGYYFYQRHKKRKFIPMTKRFYHKFEALNALRVFKRTQGNYMPRGLNWWKK